MKREYPSRPCLHCDRLHTLRGDYCSGRCRVAAWRERNRVDEPVVEPEPEPDIEFVTTTKGWGRLLVVDEVDGSYHACAHPDCMTRLPRGSHAKYCCNACRQDAYRLRKQGIT